MRSVPRESIGRTLYLPASTSGDHLDQFRAVLAGQIVVLREILVDLIEFPPFGVELRELVFVDRHAEWHARLRERGSRPRANRAPPVVIDRAMPHHFEILGDV